MVSGEPSLTKEGEGNTAVPLHTYGEQFREAFPYYLSIGMSYDEYWNGDPMLAKYYREAEEIREDKRNEELWLQGMYIYEALSDVAPLFRDLVKKGTKSRPYSDKPYAITKKARKEERIAKAKAEHDKGLKIMQALMKVTENKFGKGGGDA